MSNTIIRHFTSWFFEPPNDPWVSISFSVDARAAIAYLERLAQADGARVSLNHLLAGIIGRVLRAHPYANARIIRGRVVQEEKIGVAMPVNLLGHEAGKSRELSIMAVEDVDRRSLRDIAREARKAVKEEREGRIQNPLVARLLPALEGTPRVVVHGALHAINQAMKVPPVARAFYQQVPVTTGLTNPGATLRASDGFQFRGGAMSVPNRLVHVSTIWGTAPLQEEVMPIGGEPTVVQAIPMILVFDHRVIDGVRAGRLVQAVADLIRDPEPIFGEDGRAEGPLDELPPRRDPEDGTKRRGPTTLTGS